ncbi:MAG TPA: colicin E3/pyocin S6 family cytotoxin [Solirubrobacterales bacterium]
MARVPRPDPCFLDRLIKVSRAGGQRWRNEDGNRFYEWDGLHGEIEVYNQRGIHMGTLNAETGRREKGPKKGRRIDV